LSKLVVSSNYLLFTNNQFYKIAIKVLIVVEINIFDKLLIIIQYYYLTYRFNKLLKKSIRLIFSRIKFNFSIFKAEIQKIKKCFKK